MPPPVQFVTTADGVRIAYRRIGAGHPLVFVRGWVSHLEFLGQEPKSRAFFEALASARSVVQYDARGNGLSDRDVSEITLDDLQLDLEAIVDKLAIETFDLYGQCFGGPVAVCYAARHPERVSSLILDGTYARGSDITTPDRQAALLAGIRGLWPLSSRMLDHLTVPQPDVNASFVASQPEAISGEVAAELYQLAYEINVTDRLPQIQAPTLVLHRRGSLAIPFSLGLKLASAIPNARFVPLEGTSHNPWGGDTAALLDVVAGFLGSPIEYRPHVGVTRTGLVTILFTDMESSTATTQRLGDAEAHELVRRHNRIVRAALRQHTGAEIKQTGDGIMASFGSAVAALQCAIAIQRRFAEEEQPDGTSPLRVRIGLNAGEPLVEEQDLFGTAVQLAARICAYAQPGEILASNVVRELAAGKRFLFSDRGSIPLHGFDEPVKLYELNWRSLVGS